MCFRFRANANVCRIRVHIPCYLSTQSTATHTRNITIDGSRGRILDLRSLTLTHIPTDIILIIIYRR